MKGLCPTGTLAGAVTIFASDCPLLVRNKNSEEVWLTVA